MLLRYTSAVLLGTVATFGLLTLMRSVIADPLPAVDSGVEGHMVGWARIVKEREPIIDPPTPKRPPPPDEPPPPLPIVFGDDGPTIGGWEEPKPPAVGGVDFRSPYLDDGEYLPIRAIEHYEIALDQVPFISKAMESTMLHTLAKLCFLEGERDAGEPGEGWYSRARSAMESYVALATDPGPNAYYFLAKTHYALKDYEAGIESVENAIRIAEESDVPVRENWTRLLEYMRWKADADTG